MSTALKYYWTVTSDRYTSIQVVAASLDEAVDVAEDYWNDERTTIGVKRESAVVVSE